MEMELNKLIEKLKRDGVQEAEKDRDNIIKKAEEEARAIVENAKKNQQEIIASGQAKVKSFREAAEKALRQSARDVLLTLRERVTKFSNNLLMEKITGDLLDDILKDLIIKAVQNFRRDSDLDIEVLVSPNMAKPLEKAVLKALNKEAKDALTIHGTPGIKKGFRIGEKGKDSYIDFSSNAIAEAFIKYLNPGLVERLNLDLKIGEE